MHEVVFYSLDDKNLNLTVTRDQTVWHASAPVSLWKFTVVQRHTIIYTAQKNNLHTTFMQEIECFYILSI